MSLDPAALRDYNRVRGAKEGAQVCQAPFSNMYFNMYGQASACWLTLEKAERYPEHSIRELWFGKHFEKLRDNIKRLELTEFCGVCERNINNRCFRNPLARAYDNSRPPIPYPTIMEFELSNVCNLECVMCKGVLSSGIRRNRDKLPPMKASYDDAFAEQLEEFLPFLAEARFNGGEPFLQRSCWDIWDRIARINPKIEITIATNGTQLNDRIKAILERCRIRINVSLDSIYKDGYEAIRRKSHFETVLANMEYFSEYCRKKGTIFSVMVNPMRVNWREMPGFIRFCNERNWPIWFNTIWRPYSLALWNLPSRELAEIIAALEADSSFPNDPKKTAPHVYVGNVGIFTNFLDGQLRSWHREQVSREEAGRDYAATQSAKIGSRELFLSELERIPQPGLFERVEALRARVERNVPSENFYHILLQQPVERLATDLAAMPESAQVEWVYKQDGYY